MEEGNLDRRHTCYLIVLNCQSEAPSAVTGLGLGGRTFIQQVEDPGANP